MSIFETACDNIGDWLEIGIDHLMENSVLQEIPFVKFITALCKVGYNIRKRNLIKQTLTFIVGFNVGSIEQAKIDAYREELNSSPKKAEKELGRVIIILGNHIEVQQSAILGGFYNAYVNGIISWDKFCELSEANRRMFLSDYSILMDANKNKGLYIDQHELYQVDRLISFGLLQNNNRMGGKVTIVEIDQSSSDSKEKDIELTSFGKLFCQYMPLMQLTYGNLTQEKKNKRSKTIINKKLNRSKN